MPTRILVTGGAGYIGSVLVPALLQAGFAVEVLDNFLFQQGSLLDCCAHAHFSVVRGDCRDRSTMAHVLRNADYVIPLAAIVGAPACAADATAATTVNLEAIRLLLSLRSKDQRILFPNTNSGYGTTRAGEHCTEQSPLRPVSLYGRTKVEAEAAVLQSGNAIAFRLATVFGTSPRMRIDLLVNDFVYRAVTDRAVVVFEGHARRNFLHVRDVARAMLHAIDRFDAMKNEPYNAGLSDANLSKLQLCAEIQKQLPSFVFLEAPVGEDPDKRDYVVSNAKIEAAGFRPQFSLADGIRELIRGYAILRNARHANV